MVKARAALVPVLEVISSDLVAAISIAAVGQKGDGDQLVDPDTLTLLDHALAVLLSAATAPTSA